MNRYYIKKYLMLFTVIVGWLTVLVLLYNGTMNPKLALDMALNYVASYYFYTDFIKKSACHNTGTQEKNDKL